MAIPKMTLTKSSFRTELVSMLKLAIPIALLQLGLVFMGVIDTIFMGRLGKEYLGAVGLGHSTIFCLFIFGLQRSWIY